MSQQPNTLLQRAKALRLNKQFSQNFLIHEDTLKRIADRAAGVDPIIEIGAGSGFLTEKLLAHGATLHAIELDAKMIEVLAETFPEHPKLHLIHKNVCNVDLAELIPEKGIIVGNLPYHMTSPILFHITGEMDNIDYPLRQKITKAIVMVQKEVGERLTAKPGDTQYSQLTLQVGFWFEAHHLLNVPSRAYFPAPKVDSAVIELIPRDKPPAPVNDLTHLSKLIKKAFAHRRKTLINNLEIGGYETKSALNQLFEEIQLPLAARPQEVSILEYGTLSNALHKLEKSTG